MNVEQAKECYQKKTSEELFGITFPPDHQCKNIDTIISTLKGIYKSTNKVGRMDEEELVDLINDINSDLYRIDDDIEDIRKALEGVREWGQQWKDKCKEIIEQYNLDVEEII